MNPAGPNQAEWFSNVWSTAEDQGGSRASRPELAATGRFLRFLWFFSRGIADQNRSSPASRCSPRPGLSPVFTDGRWRARGAREARDPPRGNSGSFVGASDKQKVRRVRLCGGQRRSSGPVSSPAFSGIQSSRRPCQQRISSSTLCEVAVESLADRGMAPWPPMACMTCETFVGVASAFGLEEPQRR